METNNQNQNLHPACSLGDYMSQKKQKRNKWLIGLVSAFAIMMVGLFGYTNPQLFKADIASEADPNPTGSEELYIPSYEANAGDTGTISLKARNDISGLEALQFNILYPNNINDITFVSLADDADAVFKPGTANGITTIGTGNVQVLLTSLTPVDVVAGKVLAKFNVELSDDVQGTINFSIGGNVVSSPAGLSIDAGAITIVSADQLEVLYAEPSEDNSSVEIFFSDLLKEETWNDASQYTVTCEGDTFTPSLELSAEEDSVILNFGSCESFVEKEICEAGSPTLNEYTCAWDVELHECYTKTCMDFADESFCTSINGTTCVWFNGEGENPAFCGEDPEAELPAPKECTITVLPDVEGNEQGAMKTENNSVIFYTYDDSEEVSTVTLQSVTSPQNNKDELRLTFSDPVDPVTVIPTNLTVIPYTNDNAEKLTIRSGITTTDNTTFTLKTSLQEEGVNYFVILQGVKDANGLILGNNKVLNFKGTVPPQIQILGVTPNSLTSGTAASVVVSGKNLDTVTKAYLGTTEVSISEKSATSLTLSAPATLAVGAYDLKLEGLTVKTLTSAIVVSAAAVPTTVDSESSKAVPYRVKPGETTVLWALVKSEADLNITNVFVDLSAIEGAPSVQMIRDTAPQQPKQQWYKLEVTVDPNASTTASSDLDYDLPVRVRKESATVASGTIRLWVTNNIIDSVAPVVNSVTVSPLSIAPDATTPFTVSAKVTDMDGGDTIQNVVADLGTLGLGVIELSPLNSESTANSQYYTSGDEELTVPVTIAEGSYTITVTASDITNKEAVNTGTLTVSRSTSGPVIDKDLSYIGPQKSLPRDETTEFVLNVHVSDLDGIDDIDSVRAYFPTLGISSAALETSDTGQSGMYTNKSSLTIPKQASLGVHSINIIATDSTNAKAQLTLQIDVTDEDIYGDPPRVFSDKSYITPRVAINDGKTPVTLYAFVQDADDDIEYVVANLSLIGQVGAETSNELGSTSGSSSSSIASSDDPCKSGSKTFVCMKPSIKEGDDGQWFVLPDVTISKYTSPSSEPYMVEIVATDETGKTGKGTIPVGVNDGVAFTNDRNPPEVMTAVSTGPEEVEVLFSEEIAANSVVPEAFEIVDYNDVNSKLAVTNATINATGTIVTLTTERHIDGKEYMLIVNNKITDAVGVALVPGAKNRVQLIGYRSGNSKKVPLLDMVTAIDSDTVEVEFRDYLQPSSIKIKPVVSNQEKLAPRSANDLNIEIREADDTSKSLQVLGVEMPEGNVLKITTEPQKPDTKYRIYFTDLATYSGTESKSILSGTFKGDNTRQLVQQEKLVRTADLNGDGKVDFLDFTMFSAAYGTTYDTGTSDSSDDSTSVSSSVHQTTIDNPDSTVPHTSVPAGGNVTQ